MRLILFDVDGTLVDSQAIIHESMRLTFARWGQREPAKQETRSIIGLTLDTAIATLLNREVDDEVLGMTADYKEIYVQLSRQPEMESLPFDGMDMVLDRLSRRSDIRLGLVTGKSRRGVARMLQQPGFRDKFSVARCADDCPSKPHPAMVLECCDEAGINPANTLVIGDTSFDMEMARAARATAFGVSWGYHSPARVEAAGASAIAASANMLLTLVDRWTAGEHAAVSGSPGMLQAVPAFLYA